MKKASFFVLPLALATAFTAASAFTLNGTVTDEVGTPVQGALVKLIAKGDSAQTDKDGKFVFKEDDVLGLARFRAGHIGIVDGVLRFSQSSNAPVQVSIFDMVGAVAVGYGPYAAVDLMTGDLRAFYVFKRCVCEVVSVHSLLFVYGEGGRVETVESRVLHQ